MKLTTQDGRTLKLDRKYHLNTWTGSTRAGREKALIVTLEDEPRKVECKSKYQNFYWVHTKVLDEAVGFFETETSRQKASRMLNQAWKNGAEEFTVPQDNFEKTEQEEIEDFCEAHGLGMLILGEPGFNEAERKECARLALESDYWERRGFLVTDECGSYSASLAKYKALHEAKSA